MKSAALALALLVFCAPAAAQAADNGIVTKASKHSVQATMDRFEAAAKERGFTIVARVNHAGAAAKAGLKLRPTQLLIFGNPKGGTPIMAAAPTAGIDLPLKALCWEDGNGNVWLAYNSPAWLKARHGIEGAEKPLAGMGKALAAMATKAVE
ncbi:MAG: DUF302 domain-containing protein [Betaproteobacteria bacterium]|nr:DUF302 domain-containing protein [Betaproteobacteria bacterium]